MKSMGIRKVLVVDDEEKMCAVVKKQLEFDGYECQYVTSPEKALALLDESRFDLVISDIRMGGMDGIQLLKRIRDRFPEIAVIMITGYTSDYSYSDIIAAGAADFIAKPFELSELKAKVERIERERKMVREIREANERICRSLEEMAEANERLRLEIADRVETQMELYSAHKEIDSFLSSMPCILIEISRDRTVKRWNTIAENVLRIEAREVLGNKFCECAIDWESDKVCTAMEACFSEHISLRLNEVRFTRKDGKDGLLNLIISLVREGVSQFSGLIILGTDITEYRLMERQLAQSQKLESIGQLAAGIAHEINTPTQYVGDNTRFLADACTGLEKIHGLYDRLLENLQEGKPTDAIVRSIEGTREAIDLDYMRVEIPNAIKQSLDGIGRISSIVRSMKAFSHPGTNGKTEIDINKAIENTITVARNEWKYVADVSTDFDLSLPPVSCLPGEFNQVILNMIINSAHAIAEKVGDGCGQKGKIDIGTRRQDSFVEIRVKDDGTGIREDIRSKIFDPFFTTKDVGKGTGQGLAISHSVIVEKHGGTIDFESTLGEGTTFIIRLPI